MKFATRVAGLQGQEMFSVMDRAKKIESEIIKARIPGKDAKVLPDMIHLEIGDPGFNAPAEATKEAIADLRYGLMHYTSPRGSESLLKEAIAVTNRSRKFMPSMKQLLPTFGAEQQISLAMQCLINPGDEVLIPNPSFPTYKENVKRCDGVPIGIRLREQDDFRLQAWQVQEAISKDTKIIVLNSPSNPTGAVMTEQAMREIYDIAAERNCWILSDECYARIMYEGEFFSPSMIDNCKERVILVNSFSKSYAMTGFRIGVVTAPEELIDHMAILLGLDVSCIPNCLQSAACGALRRGSHESFSMIHELRERRDVMLEEFSKIPSIEQCFVPDGTFYLWVKVNGDDKQWCKRALEEHHVVAAYGSMFGNGGNGFVRFSFANVDENKIREAARRLREMP